VDIGTGQQAIAQARDDIIDALCLAIVASHPESDLVSIPQNPPSDQYSLPMETVTLSSFK
jgi:predicted RNase H-like nuclease